MLLIRHHYYKTSVLIIKWHILTIITARATIIATATIHLLELAITILGSMTTRNLGLWAVEHKAILNSWRWRNCSLAIGIVRKSLIRLDQCFYFFESAKRQIELGLRLKIQRDSFP